MPKLVRDLMHPGVITCKHNTRLGQVAAILARNHVHSLVVTDRDNRPLGVITDFDLMAGEWLSADPQGLDVMRTLTAGDLMSSPIQTVDIDTTASEAAKRMRDEVIRRLIVTDNDKLVGVISVSDIVASLAIHAYTKRETVGDVMSDAILVCRENTPIWAAAHAMTDTGWRSVVVLDGNGKVLGVLSGLDMLKYCDIENCNDETVSNIMHPALTIDIHSSLPDAAHKMIENHHHRLVVVDQDNPASVPLGVISSFDIVKEMARPGSVWQQ